MADSNKINNYTLTIEDKQPSSSDTYILESWKGIETVGNIGVSELVQNPTNSSTEETDIWDIKSLEGKISVPVMYIEPKLFDNIQYTVSAWNFRVGDGEAHNTLADEVVSVGGESPITTHFEYVDGYNNVVLPDGIRSVVFSDTATPNTPDNKVKVRVYFDVGYTMPSAPTLFQIDINTYNPLHVWSPLLPSYKTTVLLTNAIWPQHITTFEPGSISQSDLDLLAHSPVTNYRFPAAQGDDKNFKRYDASSNVATITIDDDGIIPQSLSEYKDANVFYKAEYTKYNAQGTAGINNITSELNGWNNFEIKSKQNNFKTIQNCTVYQLNSSIDNVEPNGSTWVSKSTDSIGSFITHKTPGSGSNNIAEQNGDQFKVLKWRVKPNTGYSVDAVNFSVMSWDVRTWKFTEAYNPGYTDPATGNTCLNVIKQIDNNSFTVYPNASNIIGNKDSNFPVVCQHEDINGNIVTRGSVDSIMKGFGYHYLDGIGGNENSDFTGDSNENDTSCTNCWGDLATISHHKYEYTPSGFNTFLGYGTYGTSFTDNISNSNNTVYLYTKPKTFKSPQKANGPALSSISSSKYGTYIPHEPNYDAAGSGATLQSTSTAYERSSGSCGAGQDAMFKWVTFHNVLNSEGINEVEVTGWVCPDWTPSVLTNETYLLQINGLPTLIDPQEKTGINTSFDLESSYLNSGNITITPTNTKDVKATVTTTIKRGGFKDEKTTYNISGKFPNDKPTVVASVKFESTKDSSDTYTHYFLKKPSLTRESIFKRLNKGLPNSIKMVLKSRTSNNVYNFDLIYHNNINTSAADKLIGTLNFKQTSVVTKSIDITRVDIGRNRINSNGGSRRITIHGKPGATFTLLVNRLYKQFDANYTDHVLSYHEESIIGNSGNIGTEGPMRVLKGDEAKKNKNSTTYAAIHKTIGPRGKYSFVQKFPKTTTETSYNVYVKSTGVAYANISGDILNWSKADYSRWPGYYVKTMTQYKDPVLTLKATVGGNYALTHVGGVAISPAPSAGDDYSATYTGKPNATRNRLSKTYQASSTDFDVTYVLNATTSKTFTNTRNPVFSNTIAYDGKGAAADNDSRLSSDWTNTIPSENGGTEIDIIPVSTIVSADTTVSPNIANGLCTISFSVRIQKWGTKDLTIDLDLDKIVQTS